MEFGWLWIIGAIVLGVMEIATGALMFALMAVAALLTGLLAMIGLPPYLQLVVFLAGCIGAAVLAPRLARRFHSRMPEERFGVDALIDQIGIVTQPIDPLTGTGMVRLGADLWRARANEALPEGARVRIVEVSGTAVLVRPERRLDETTETVVADALPTRLSGADDAVSAEQSTSS